MRRSIPCCSWCLRLDSFPDTAKIWSWPGLQYHSRTSMNNSSLWLSYIHAKVKFTYVNLYHASITWTHKGNGTLINVGGQTGKDCLLTLADSEKSEVADRQGPIQLAFSSCLSFSSLFIEFFLCFIFTITREQRRKIENQCFATSRLRQGEEGKQIPTVDFLSSVVVKRLC